MKSEKLAISYELARYFDKGVVKNITVADYQRWEAEQAKNEIANFIFQRLHSRYLKPFLFNDARYRKEFKNGFSIIANCCLLIETLQSFKSGWKDTKSNSRNAFVTFFNTDRNFLEFKTLGKVFFEDIRCGILHQGETKRGWRISRNGKSLLIGKSINSIVFLKQMEKSLLGYKEQLESEDWESKCWKRFRAKMNTVISNCAE